MKTARPTPFEYPTLKLRLDHIELSRPRQWGGCWLALELWNRLDLDAFWQPLLPDSQKGTPWFKVIKTLTAYRLLEPGSEWKLHRSWFDRRVTGPRSSCWWRAGPCVKSANAVA